MGGRVTSQLALEGAPVNAQDAGGLADVALSVGQDTLNMLPLDPLQRWR